MEISRRDFSRFLAFGGSMLLPLRWRPGRRRWHKHPRSRMSASG